MHNIAKHLVAHLARWKFGYLLVFSLMPLMQSENKQLLKKGPSAHKCAVFNESLHLTSAQMDIMI